MPDFKAAVREHLSRLKLRPAREASIVEELAQHLEDRYQELVARGMSSEEATRHVLAELSEGNLLAREMARVEEQVRWEAPAPGGPWYGGLLANIWQDIRYGARTLRLNAGFTAVAILSLALGIGANTAIFQLLDAVSLRSLPVKNADQLVEINSPNTHGRSGSFRNGPFDFTNPLWEQIRDHQEGLSGVLAWGNTGFSLTSGGQVRVARGLFVSGDFFHVLGVEPVAGRLFNSDDDKRGCGSPPAVISYAFWQGEYGGNPAIVGKAINLGSHLYDVIGVTPPGFFGLQVGRAVDVSVPLCAEPIVRGEGSIYDHRDGWWLGIMGRLKPGWSAAKATTQLEAISPGVTQATLPGNYTAEESKPYLAMKLAALPAAGGISNLKKAYQQPLWLLLGLAGAVLLIACANLANLMFARAGARQHEIAVRLALGASRARLLQQLLAESLLLAGTGAALGVGLAQALSRLLVSLLETQGNPLFLNLGVDWRVLGFTAGLALLTCVLFGLAPAIRAALTPPGAAMKAGRRGVTATRERFGLRRTLVVAQVALSLVLLVGAMLFVRTFQNLAYLDAGFRRDGILVAFLNMSKASIPTESRNRFKRDLLEQVRAVPGVEAAAESAVIPLSGNIWNDNVHTAASGAEKREVANFNAVSPGYFKTAGIVLTQGRDVSDQDTLSSQAVAVVNETFVRKLLNGVDPLGKMFRVEQSPGKPEPMYQIIGVVKDTKYDDLREEFTPIVYLARMQDKQPDLFGALTLRCSLPPSSLIPSVEHAITKANGSIWIQFSVFKTQVRDSLRSERLMASLSGFFGILAVVLATIGLYGVISYMVVRRRNEIGIRMALGADRVRVLALVLREAVILLVIGLAAGTIVAWFTAKIASSLLFGLTPRDPGSLVFAVAMLAVVAIAASYIPAYGAARVDPLEALREE